MSGAHVQPPVTDADREALLGELHDRIVATAELPVDPAASRWLGEAEAVAGDVARADAPPAAVELRVRQVRELLENATETGHPEADDHVTAALDLTTEILE